MKMMTNELLTHARQRHALESLAELITRFIERRAQRRRLARNYNTAHRLARMNLL